MTGQKKNGGKRGGIELPPEAMTTKPTYLFVIFSLLIAYSGQSALGYEIYKWVDEDGVVHFSEVKPSDVATVRTLRVTATNAPDYDPNEDPYSIRNQAERTGALWSRLEERKAARRERQREAAERAQAPPINDPEYYYRSPGFYAPIRPFHPVFNPRPFKTAKRQFAALDKLGLDSTNRPHSINSSAHRARTESSFSTLFVNPSPPKTRPPVHPRPGRPPASYELH